MIESRRTALTNGGRTNRRRRAWWVVASVLAVAAGTAFSACRWHAGYHPELPAAEASQVAPRSAGRVTTTLNLPAGLRLTYPPGWEPTTTRDFVLMLVPAGSRFRSLNRETKLLWGEEFISLDVPKLPAFRIPGFLPMNRIRGGYLDHLRKQTQEARVEDLEAPPIPDAKAALVRTTWPGNRPTHVETALLLTHADRVYILRGWSRTEDEPLTRAAFDQVVQSLRWNTESGHKSRG